MIIVMGLPGAGKSTVLNALKEKRKDYVIQNYGDMMFQIEKEKFGIQNRDDMRKLPIDKQKEVQKLVGERLSMEKGRFILDTHCSVRTPKGYYPGMPFSLLKELKVDALVMITADLEEIKKRRSNDPSRVRDTDDVGEHDSINRSYLAAYSAFSGAPAVIIYNRDGKVEESVKQLEAVMQ